jgi:hypothetical protein
MPLYDLACECGRTATDVFQKMVPAQPHLCVCGRAMERVPVSTHTDLKEYHTPIEMYSVALEDLEEIREFSKRCPDAQISMDPADEMYGVPIAKSRKAKLQILKAAGHHENNSERVRV